MIIKSKLSSDLPPGSGSRKIIEIHVLHRILYRKKRKSPYPLVFADCQKSRVHFETNEVQEELTRVSSRANKYLIKRVM